MVADGVGATIRRADVLIDDGVIAAVGGAGGLGEVGAVGGVDGSPGDCEVVDLAAGSVICPGFIDAHAHAEGPLLDSGVVLGALAQGVTTLVVGQDGESWIGANEATARYLNLYFAPVNGALSPVRSLSVGEYREAVSGRLVQNVAVLASQGTIRHNVAGLSAAPLGPAERAGGPAGSRGRAGGWGGRAVQRAGLPAEPVRRRWTRSRISRGRWHRRGGRMSRT